MSHTLAGRWHVTATTAVAVVSVGLLAAGPPAQTAGAGRWGPVEKIAPIANLNDYGPYDYDPIYNYRQRPALVAVRANGSSVTAWIDPHPSPRRLLASRRSAVGGWRSAHELTSGLAGAVGAFDLAVGGAGSASVVWASSNAKKSWVEESHLTAGTWSAPVRVGRGTRPSTAVDGNGVTTLAWLHRGVWVAQRAHGDHWTRPTPIARPAAGEQFYDLQLASNSSGDIAAAWKAYAGAGDRIVVAVHPHANASWTTPRTLEMPVYVSSLRLAMDGSGRALVVWSAQKDESRAYLRWARSTPRGDWSSSRTLTPDIGADGALVDVSTNRAGLAVATWLNVAAGSDGSSSLWAARFGGNGSWSAPSRVTGGTRDWFDSRPWMDDTGVAHLVAAGFPGGIWAFSQRPGAAWRGGTLNRGNLIAAEGSGSRLVIVFYRKLALRSRVLDVR